MQGIWRLKKMTKTFTPSPQQADFLNWVANDKGSCVLEAVAGAGKTTVLIEAVKLTGGNVAILAYNRRQAEGTRHRLEAGPSRHRPQLRLWRLPQGIPGRESRWP